MTDDKHTKTAWKLCKDWPCVGECDDASHRELPDSWCRQCKEQLAQIAAALRKSADEARAEAFEEAELGVYDVTGLPAHESAHAFKRAAIAAIRARAAAGRKT